jgi:hypothetical protein
MDLPLADPDFTVSRQNAPLSDKERQRLVSARAAELMREAGYGAYLEPTGPAWVSSDIRN